MALVVKNPAVNAGAVRDTCSIPESGRSPREGHGDPLQDFCLEYPMDRGAWQATVHGVTESDMTERLNSYILPGGTVDKNVPMQGTRVQSLVQKDPTCHRTASEAHMPRAHALQPP